MKNENNYTVEEKKRKKRKLLLALLLISFSLVIFAAVAAYFSDFLRDTTDMSTSTLDINGAYTYTLNGTTVTADDLTNLNPGDVIVVNGTITNIGNQSAWLQERIIFADADAALLPYLQIYRGAQTQEDFVLGTDLTADLLDLTDGAFVGGNKVINGTGTNAQVETDDTFDLIGSNTYNFTLTIYFMHSAPNATQNKVFGLTIETRALQFKNNNTAEPDADAWAAVEVI